MYWKCPPKIKIYEALGAIADKRIRITGNSAQVYSSTGSKFYTVMYDAQERAIMANDNGSYWVGYFGYPAIAFLMKKKIISFKPSVTRLLKGISWKDINVKFKHNFDQTERFVIQSLPKDKAQIVQNEVQEIFGQLKKLKLSQLGPRIRPPTGD